jgi:hypothetical protein
MEKLAFTKTPDGDANDEKQPKNRSSARELTAGRE